MKQLYLVLTGLFLAFAASAQSVVWCPPGAEWYFEIATNASPGYVHLKYVSDTTIAGQPCKKLKEHYKVVNLPSGNTTEYYTNRYTYEDSGIVYGYYEGINTTAAGWDTLYNFNASPGDSWFLYGSGNQVSCFVSDTGFETINDAYLKWVDVLYNTTDIVYSVRIYETIGWTGQEYPFMATYMEIGPGVYNFCNYSDTTLTNWPVSDASCAALPTVSQPVFTSETKFTVYPNPTSNKFTINLNSAWENQYADIKLRDVFGRIVLKEKRMLANDQTEISLAEYPAGLYFLHVSNQNQSYTAKVVKN